MSSLRQLKTKIRAGENISQITRAMELVAATKMRKAQERALQGRPYAMHALSLLSRIVRSTETGEQLGSLWHKRTKGKMCLVVVTSDKGLCGSFNSAILKTASKYLQDTIGPTEQVEVVAVGKKTRDFFKKREIRVAAEFLKFSDVLTLSDAEPLFQWILREYRKGTYKQVTFCSTVFVSALFQRPLIHALLPLQAQELAQIVENIVPRRGKYAELHTEPVSGTLSTYVLEPSTHAILEELAEDLVEVAVLHLLLESNASEHSARMLAMKNASDNASELIDTLTLQLNKARQAAITQELTEIATAKEALTYE